MTTTLGAPLGQRLSAIQRELRFCRMMGIDPLRWIAAADLDLAAAHGLLDGPNEDPAHDDR